MLPKSRLRKSILLVGAALVVALVVGFSQLRDLTLRLYVLNARGPTLPAMIALVNTYDDQADMMHDFWATQMLHQRFFALEIAAKNMPYHLLRPYLINAVQDPDADLAMLGLQLLTREPDPDNLPIYGMLLNDADPNLRWRACIAMGTLADQRHVAWVTPSLDDSVHKVQLAAMGALQRWTGIDDGVYSQSEPLAIQAAADMWRDMFVGTAPAIDAVPPPARLAERASMQAPSVKLKSLDGERFDLRTWRGNAVVLVFWTSAEPWSLKQVQNVMAAAQSCPGIQVASLNVDAVPTLYVEHGKAEQSDASPTAQPMPEQIAWPFLQLAADIHAIVAYRVQETPVTLLIDGQGRLQRRLTGLYAPASLVDMLTEIADCSGE